MPAVARAAAEMRPCVVVAGCVMVLRVSPRLAVIEDQAQAIHQAPGRGATTEHLKRDHCAKATLLALGSSAC